MRPTSPATRTPSSTSSIRRRRRLPGGSIITRALSVTPEDAEHYEQTLSNTKFYDPDYRSCTKFIADVTENRFGFNKEPVAEVIEWADIIDGALYPDPQTAVEMRRAGDEADHGDRVEPGFGAACPS